MSKYLYHVDGTLPVGNDVFVFGSNKAGVHGAGSARAAYRSLGAVWGVGKGPTGQCYALPTKDENIESMTLDEIQEEVLDFIEVASNNQHRRFFVTRTGCGLAGYTDDQIAPMFKGAPTNCDFPNEWKQYLEN